MGLKRIYGSKNDKVPGGWRKMNTEKLYNFYTLLNTLGREINETDMGGICSTTGAGTK
jgi:hypothetical protein